MKTFELTDQRISLEKPFAPEATENKRFKIGSHTMSGYRPHLQTRREVRDECSA